MFIFQSYKRNSKFNPNFTHSVQDKTSVHIPRRIPASRKDLGNLFSFIVYLNDFEKEQKKVIQKIKNGNFTEPSEEFLKNSQKVVDLYNSTYFTYISDGSLKSKLSKLNAYLGTDFKLNPKKVDNLYLCASNANATLLITLELLHSEAKKHVFILDDEMPYGIFPNPGPDYLDNAREFINVYERSLKNFLKDNSVDEKLDYIRNVLRYPNFKLDLDSIDIYYSGFKEEFLHKKEYDKKN